MPDAIWIDRHEELAALAATLGAEHQIGLDTEFLRERTFFPRLCLLQIAAGNRIWCIDTLRGDLRALVPVLVAAATQKVIHAARQDLEAIHLHSQCLIAPVFDTQIAAGCIGLKPQIGYAELAQALLGVAIAKGQTRTDWSRRPLSAAQLHYAAEDVEHLGEIAARLTRRLRELGREAWVLEDCQALSDPSLYAADPERAAERVRGLAQLPPHPRQRARALAAWREREARERDMPRSWILSDTAIFDAAQVNPPNLAALRRLRSLEPDLPDALALSVLETLQAASRREPEDMEPGRDARPTAEQKSVLEKLGKLVQHRAAELGISAEILAPRGELKALALGDRDTACLRGWRRDVVGAELLAGL
ncbi:MAG: ribonuclease D [Steroidobacterales bacterium]